MEKNRNMKKGFSLVELVIVIVIMGVLSAVVFNSLSGTKDNIEIQNSISTTTRLIAEGISQYKENNDNSYKGIGATNVAMYLPSKVEFTGTLGAAAVATDYIKSLGLNGDCYYHIFEDKNKDGGTISYGVKVLMDCKNGTLDSWTDKDKYKAEQLFISNMQKYSDSNISKVPNATALGAINAAFTETDNTPKNGIVGIRYFTN